MQHGVGGWGEPGQHPAAPAQPPIAPVPGWAPPAGPPHASHPGGLPRHHAGPPHPAQRPAAPPHPAGPPPLPAGPPHSAPVPPPHGVPRPPAHVPGTGGQPTGPVVPVPEPTGHIPLPAAAPPAPGTGVATLAVLLIGPAGAGKTTVARHWAGSRQVPTAHISLDDVREWVCSGFADPQSGWNDHSEAQYRLARRTCGFAARNFLANGISCILDDAVFPDRPVVGLGGWKRHVGPGLLPVVLLPGLEIVLERNAARSGNRRLSDEEVARIHGRMAGWYGSGLPIIDNSHLDVEGTARALDEVLARAIAAPGGW
ncbi:ATP-binding protein [Streptomyces sp. NBC_00536]|uniref:AAA family ATPase n=1 Tax=Streptomyces sp. NBC_00536 TaxID=2975769 RepID=UPI002E822E83|nr:AAA family ATPase [Streptomyces sp. NBC_00536]WUC78055.1 ATP-binding protein [Streptomyces sp. NBC_00536]